MDGVSTTSKTAPLLVKSCALRLTSSGATVACDAPGELQTSAVELCTREAATVAATPAPAGKRQTGSWPLRKWRPVTTTDVLPSRGPEDGLIERTAAATTQARVSRWRGRQPRFVARRFERQAGAPSGGA